MWSPLGSRACSLSIVTKDWQFSWSFLLGFIAVFFSFFHRVGAGHVFLCSMWRTPSVGCITFRMFFPSSFSTVCFLLSSMVSLSAVCGWGSFTRVISHPYSLVVPLTLTCGSECQKSSIYCFPPATGTTGTGSYRA